MRKSAYKNTDSTHHGYINGYHLTVREHLSNAPTERYKHPSDVQELQTILQRSRNISYIYAPLDNADFQNAIQVMRDNGILSQLILVTDPSILRKYKIYERPTIIKTFKGMAFERSSSIEAACKLLDHSMMIYGASYML